MVADRNMLSWIQFTTLFSIHGVFSRSAHCFLFTLDGFYHVILFSAFFFCRVVIRAIWAKPQIYKRATYLKEEKNKMAKKVAKLQNMS